MPELTTPGPDEKRCEAIAVGLFGPARCPQAADVVAHGACTAGHESELLLCNACRLVLDSVSERALSGPCPFPASTGLPNEYCDRPVSLDHTEVLHA